MTRMTLTLDQVAKASYRVAMYDLLLSIAPDQEMLVQVRTHKLECFLPAWADWKSGEINPDALDAAVMQVLRRSYLLPTEFLEYEQYEHKEKRSAPELPSDSSRALNY